jgi:hypothetical protein
VYGQEAMLPVEINLQTWRVAGQVALSTEEYAELRMENIDDVHKSRFKVLGEIEKDKLRVAKTYNR